MGRIWSQPSPAPSKVAIIDCEGDHAPTPKLSIAKSLASSLMRSANLFVSTSSLSPGFVASTNGLTRSRNFFASVSTRCRFSSHDFFSSSYAFWRCSADCCFVAAFPPAAPAVAAWGFFDSSSCAADAGASAVLLWCRKWCRCWCACPASSAPGGAAPPGAPAAAPDSAPAEAGTDSAVWPAPVGAVPAGETPVAGAEAAAGPE